MKTFVLALLFCSIPVLAADEALPKAETILDRNLEATGGRAAYEKLHSEIMHGTIEFVGKGIKGSLTVYHAAPDQALEVIDFENIGKIASGSNGEVAWENSVLQGPRLKQGPERADAFRDGTFNAALNWKKLYTKAETTGVETVEGHECYRVVMTPVEGNPVTQFYDKKTSLLIKTSATRKTPMGDISADVLADDYKPEGPYIVPHKMTSKFAGQAFEIRVEKVEFNVDIPKSQFELPAEIQALVKKSQEAATKAAPAMESKDTGKLTLYMAGKPMATENYTVTKSAGKIEVNGSGNAAIGPMKIDIEQFKVVTDDKYQPLEASAKAKLGQLPMNVKTSFIGGKAKNEIDSGQGPKSKEDDMSVGAIVVNQNIPLYPWSFLAMRVELKNQDPQQFAIYVLGQSEVPATVIFKGKETVEFASKSADLNHFNVATRLPQGQPVNLDFWIDDSRKVIKIAVPSQSVEAYQDGFDPKPVPVVVPKG